GWGGWCAGLDARRTATHRARREAGLVVNYYRGRAKVDLSDHEARLGWADALAFLEDFGGATAVLEEGLKATREPAYREALARVHVAWFDTRKREGAPAGELRRLAAGGLRHGP